MSRAFSNASFGVREVKALLIARPWVWFCICLSVVDCGSSSSSSFATHGTLLSIEFPDPSDQNAFPESEPPENASLVQQVVFQFNARPDPAKVSSQTLPIVDSLGLPVSGAYRVDGSKVVFTPSLPTRPVDLEKSPSDSGGAGLEPSSLYSVRASSRLWSFIDAVAADLLKRHPDAGDPSGVEMFLTTTSNPALFFTGLDPVSPQLLASSPEDGATGISPNLLSDPEGLFPPRQSFLLTFSQPLHPAVSNVGDGTFHLIDLDELSGTFPLGVPLGIDARLLVNEVEGSVVEVVPSGILPMGHLLSLEYPRHLQGLSEGETAGEEGAVAAMFTVADVPGSHSGSLVDRLREDFDTEEHRGSLSDVELGSAPAAWDQENSNILQARPSFESDGPLGRFVPSAPPAGETHAVQLDTSRQLFPLFDGSTPDAPAGTVIEGGVFSFTDVDIPAGVVVLPSGPNPLVILATGTVRIAGEIRVDGLSGSADSAYDSGVISVPGGNSGAGGGRGGLSHPIVFYPPDVVSLLALVDPLRGASGSGGGEVAEIGGKGGEVGILDHEPIAFDMELDARSCDEVAANHANGGKVPGGGGGSFLFKGDAGRDGIGNVRPDGRGGYVIPGADDSTILFAGSHGASPFPDSDRKNDFIGLTGELQQVVGGQGGGGGGSRMESYYCGNWCFYDADNGNDGLCLGGEFPPFDPSNQTFAAAVGDARGGGGGGGGGAVQIRALGRMTVESSARLSAVGGSGRGGETLGCSNYGGSGGGGSGGAILLESLGGITVRNGARLDVTPGQGGEAVATDQFDVTCNTKQESAGAGGDGSPGIIQLQVPFGMKPVVENTNSIVPLRAWADPDNERNPAAFTPLSVAVSSWFDFGRMIARDADGPSPRLQFRIAGEIVDFSNDGLVKVDAEGFVVEPAATDVECDYLGRLDPSSGGYFDGEEPHADFIPRNATVRVQFQGADALVEGSKEVDPSSLTEWSPTPAVADGRQFVRYRISFDIAADGSQVRPDAPLPAVQEIAIDAEYGRR